MKNSQGSRNILIILKEDHRKMEGLISKLLDESKAEKNSPVFMQFAEEIRAHSKAEEEVLYAELESMQPTREMIAASRKEHETLSQLVDQVETSLRSGRDSTEWLPQIKSINEKLEQHVQQEEGEVFSHIKDIFDPAQLGHLGAAFLEKKALLLRSSRDGKETAA